MKTMKLYKVTLEGMGLKSLTMLVAAASVTAAKRQTKEYSTTVRRVGNVEQVGVVNVPA